MGYAEDAMAELHGWSNPPSSGSCNHDHINDLGEEIVQVSVRAGWVPEDRVERRSFGDLMALLHSEVSEALEEYRDGHDFREVYYRPYHGDDSKPPKPEGIPIELADVAIRLLYTAAIYGIDLEAAIREKIEFNKTRDRRHGDHVVQGADGKRL